MLTLNTDVLIVGGGAAGLRATISAAEQNVDVILVNKGAITRSGITPTAEFGILGQVDLCPGDSQEELYNDIIRVGYQLSDQNLVNVYVRDIRKRILELESFGCPFRKTEGGKFFQYIVPGEKYPRNLSIRGGGYSLLLVLRKEALRHVNVRLMSDLMIMRLLRQDEHVVGAVGYDFKCGELLTIVSKSVIIATGGYERLWPVTDCPPGATGDGQSLAFDAGAELVDLEMVLHYPSVIVWPKSVSGLIVPYEYLDEESFFGGEITNSNGESVLGRPLPTREVACRLIEKEIKEGNPTPHGGVYWDITHSPKSEKEIISIFKESGDQLQEYVKTVSKIDVIKTPIEVAPASHFQLGGIRINEKCETNVPGLFAAGEGAGNLLGANRMAGNGLAPTQVFGAIAGESAAKYAKDAITPTVPEKQVKEEFDRLSNLFLIKKGKVRPREIREELCNIMNTYVGMEITEAGLNTAIRAIRELKEKMVPKMSVLNVRVYNLELFEAFEVMHMLELAVLVAMSALLRKESRGHFYRADYPGQDDKNWMKHTVVKKDGKADCTTMPPVKELYHME
jgi:fumarate reductase (CoM/CoB) subunit A